MLCKLAKGEAGFQFLLVGRSARGPVSKPRASSSEAGATDHTARRRLTHSFSGTIIASYLYDFMQFFFQHTSHRISKTATFGIFTKEPES